MNKKLLIITGCYILLNCFGIAHAGISRPTYSIELVPGFSPSIQLASNAKATINYTVRNLEQTPRILTVLPIASAINQIVTTQGSCPAPVFRLASGQSCILELQVNGALVAPNQIISSFPTVCKTIAPGSNLPDPNRCARTSIPLNITSSSAPPIDPVTQTIAFFTSYTNTMISPIQPTLPAGSIPWKVQPIVTFAWKLFATFSNGGTGIPASADLVSTSCGSAFNGSAYCALVGKDQNSGAPLVMHSYNGGATWTNISIPSLPAQGQFNGVSCATDPNGISNCVAIGFDASNIPFVIQTINSGQTWSRLTTLNFSNATLNNVNCTVNAGNTLCQITGFNPGDQGPVIYVYTPTTSWTTQQLYSSIVNPNSSASAISCVSLANSDISCLVALSNGGSYLNLFKTLLSGTAYSATPIILNPGQFSNITINAVSCALNAGTAFCIGAGAQSGIPFVLKNSDISIDSNWLPVTVTSSSGVFATANCAAFNSQLNCVAAGQTGSTSSPVPLLAVTMDGSSWASATIDGVPDVGYYNSSSCSISSGQIFCFVNGVNPLVNQPFAVGMPGTNGGWQLANTLNSIFTLA